MAFLEMIRGGEARQVIPLDRDRLVLGRGRDADVYLKHVAVGREHARLVREGDAYYLEDLQSRGGTWLNGAQVHRARVRLKHNDRIQIADLVFIFHEGPASGSGEGRPRNGSDPRARWEQAAAELKAARATQWQMWGGLDNAVLARCLAGEADEAELRRFETVRSRHPALAELAELVRGALAGEMPRGELGRNLLLGVLALQRGLIDEVQLAEACAGRGPGSLSDFLARRQWLRPADRETLERLVGDRIREAGGDSRTALAACAGSAARRALAAAGDPEVRRLLHEVFRSAGGKPPRPPAGG
jgi:pSer/pThr/pTyr-binding forkhead associated (FHA) protein